MRTKLVTILLSFILISISNIAFGQSDETKKIKDSFLKAIKLELKSLKAWGISSKNDPEKALQHFHSDGKWHTFYSTWNDKFSYDIKKSDSIISPYIGIVTFYSQEWEKEGVSKEECLTAPWKPVTSPVDGSVAVLSSTLKYALQDGRWVLIEKPPVYKRY